MTPTLRIFLDRLEDELCEEILPMPIEELVADARERGVDLEAGAERMRVFIAAMIKGIEGVHHD